LLGSPECGIFAGENLKKTSMKIKHILSGVAILAIVLSVSLLSSCTKGIKCGYSEITFTVADSEVVAVQKYITDNKITATKDPRGFFYAIETAGDATHPVVCDNISFKYVGKLTNGTIFDQSATPVSFDLGQLILGWQWGLPYIGSGGKIRLILPPSIGYGNSRDQTDANGNVIIPKGSILDFEVDLVSVRKK
jgi:FKBP-type peptidyl-prolyl cis-trans isomerase FkpA